MREADDPFSRLSWWIIAAGAVLLPIVVGFGVHDSFRLPKQLLFFAIAIVLACITAIAAVLGTGDLWRRAVAHRAAATLAAAALGWTIVTALAATNRTLSIAAIGPVLAAIVIGLVTLAVFGERSPRALAVLLIPAIPNAIILLLQARGVWNPVRFPAEIIGRMRYTALVGNPDDVGVYFVVPVLVALALAIVDRRWRIAYVAVAALFAVAILATLTVTAVIALIAGLMALAICANRRAGIVVAAAVALLVVAAVFAYAPLRARVLHLERTLRAGNLAAVTTNRTVTFATTWEMFADHPLMGVGPGCFRYEYLPYRIALDTRHPRLAGPRLPEQSSFGQAHNDHLQLLAETGLPGYAIFIAAVIVIAAVSFRGDADDPRHRVARLLGFPLATALIVSCTAQFPLHLATVLYEYLFAGAACLAWNRVPPGSSRRPVATERRLEAGATRGKAVAVLIAVAGAYAIHRFCIVPYRCSRIEQTIEARTTAAFDLAQSPRARELARDSYERVAGCLDEQPANVNLRMLAAANLRMLDRNADAAAMYESALRYDRRPELYANLAVVQAALGQTQRAVDNYVVAGDFAGKEYLLELPEVAIRSRAYAIVAQHEEALFAARGDVGRRDIVTNGTFAAAGPRGATTRDDGSNAMWTSAASAWSAYSNLPGVVVTEIVPSTRRRGATMLHVVAAKKDAGIVQQLDVRSGTVNHALTDVWVYVVRGGVYAGSGNGGATAADVHSSATGRWERLLGRSQSCPVNETLVFSSTDDTEFFVDSVAVHEIQGPPCQ